MDALVRITHTCDCLNMFCRYVFLCNEVSVGLIQEKPVCGAAVNLVNQLLPSLLLLHHDVVPNVRITLARCLARHFACLRMFTFLLTLSKLHFKKMYIY